MRCCGAPVWRLDEKGLYEFLPQRRRERKKKPGRIKARTASRFGDFVASGFDHETFREKRMIGSLRIVTLVVLLGVVTAAQAETVYVAARLRVDLRAAAV